MKKWQAWRGFTIMELMFSVVILLILAAIAYFGYTALSNKARMETARLAALQTDDEATLLASRNDQAVNDEAITKSLAANYQRADGQPKTTPLQVGDQVRNPSLTVTYVAPGTFEYANGSVSLCYRPNSTIVGNPSSSEAYTEGPCNGQGTPPASTPSPTPTGSLPSDGGVPSQTASPKPSLVVDPSGLPGPVTSAVIVKDTGDSVTLHWEAPVGNVPLTGYAVNVIDSRTSKALKGTSILTKGTTSTVGGLTPGAALTFKISAVNTLGTGPVTVVQTASPDAPTNLTRSFGPGTVTLTWEQKGAVTTFHIERMRYTARQTAAEISPAYLAARARDNATAWEEVGTTTGDVTTFTDTLPQSGRYGYRVVADNTRGQTLSQSRVLLTGSPADAPDVDSLDASHSGLCSSSAGGQWLLSVKQTEASSPIINYTVNYDGTEPGSVTGSLDMKAPNYSGSMILTIPGTAVTSVTLADDKRAPLASDETRVSLIGLPACSN